jgi:hypothetical protein
MLSYGVALDATFALKAAAMGTTRPQAFESALWCDSGYGDY